MDLSIPRRAVCRHRPASAPSPCDATLSEENRTVGAAPYRLYMAPPPARESRCARRQPTALSWVGYRDPAGRLLENELEEILQASAT